MKATALAALAGVGDKSLGEWYEWTGYAFHIRRRLSVDEQILVGSVIDLRGTDGWQERFDRIKDDLPAACHQLAMQEKA